MHLYLEKCLNTMMMKFIVDFKPTPYGNNDEGLLNSLRDKEFTELKLLWLKEEFLFIFFKGFKDILKIS